MSLDKAECNIQREIVAFLQARGWHVERILGNSFQFGLPDLYAFCKKWGSRWIEVKRPAGYSLTLRQRQKFPQWEKAGIPIYILNAATEDQYQLLFGPANWRAYWKESDRVPTKEDIDAMLDELVREGEQSQASSQENAIPTSSATTPGGGGGSDTASPE